MKHNAYLFAMAMTTLLAMSSCRDEDAPSITPEDLMSEVKLGEGEVQIGSDGRYYSVTATVADNGELKNVRATTDADWIELEADTLSSTGSLTFYVKPNTTDFARQGTVSFRLGSSPLDTKLKVNQRSLAEDEENWVPGGALTRQSRVGYGYNMFMDYMDPKSVTEQILDYQKLVEAEKTWGAIISEDGRASQTLDLHTAYSIEEMAAWMTQQVSTEVNMIVYSKKVEKFKRVEEHKEGQSTYGYSSLSKTVATRYLDAGKVESLLRQGNNLFTADFSRMYEQVNSQPTRQNIAQLITKFGTHLVNYADLGGRLDYMVNFRSEETSRESVERYMEYKNGKKKKDEMTTETSHEIVNKGDSLSFDIYGGTREAIRNLTANANTKDRYGQVDSRLLGEWLNSVNPANPGSLSMVRCMLQPIWQLFTNPDARSQIISYLLQMARTEGGDLSARLAELSLDNYYRFDITSSMEQWPDNNRSTLVRLGYFDGRPKVEICNEYVPELRGDRRVTIYYPIFQGQTNIRRGFFPGDGENPPAEVMFDNEGGCYVRPIEGFKAGDRLTTVYYIDGAFYPSSMGIAIPRASLSVREHTVDLVLSGSHYPVVKIGPGYWLRYNVEGLMDFGEPADPDDPYCYDYYMHEDLKNNGMLYANIFYGNSLAYRENFPGVFDADVDEFGNRIHWYLPRVKDIEALKKYIGQNCKALFPGMQSGFEAQFAGYLGEYDDLNNGRSFPVNEMHYLGEYCFIPAKEVVTNSGEALVLKPDYTLTKCAINKTRDNWYPVRAYRSSYYKYK